MRPTPQEVITGAIGVLTDTVGPQVGDEYAASRLREVCALLGQIDWNDAAAGLSADNDAAVALLQQWAAWVKADASRAQAFSSPTQRTTALLESPVARGFEALNARNSALRGAVADAATAVRQWAGDDPERLAAAKPLLTAMLENYSSANVRRRQAPD